MQDDELPDNVASGTTMEDRLFKRIKL